jgi:lipopolysaccharide biosynthesis protein
MVPHFSNELCSKMLRKYENNSEAEKKVLDRIPSLVSSYLNSNKGTDWSGYEKYLSQMCFEDLTEYFFLIYENKAISAAQQLLRNGTR